MRSNQFNNRTLYLPETKEFLERNIDWAACLVGEDALNRISASLVCNPKDSHIPSRTCFSPWAEHTKDYQLQRTQFFISLGFGQIMDSEHNIFLCFCWSKMMEKLSWLTRTKYELLMCILKILSSRQWLSLSPWIVGTSYVLVLI